MTKKLFIMTCLLALLFMAVLSNAVIKQNAVALLTNELGWAKIEYQGGIKILKLDSGMYFAELNDTQQQIKYKLHNKFRRYKIIYETIDGGEMRVSFFNYPQGDLYKSNEPFVATIYDKVSINGHVLSGQNPLFGEDSLQYTQKLNGGEKVELSFEVKRYLNFWHFMRQIDVLMWISFGFLCFFGAYKSASYLSRFKLFEQASRIDIVFLVVFFAFLFMPMCKISNDDISEEENRTLAKYMPLLSGDGLNYTFGADFNAWFQDRFYGRRPLIKMFGFLKALISPRENESVLVGRDGWLFLKKSYGLENYRNSLLLTDEELESAAGYVAALDKWSRAHGKDFYYVICPDKHRLYGENIIGISKVRPDSESQTQQFIKYLREHTKVKVIYLLDALNAQKDKGLLYFKNDTHWTPLGAYWGYAAFMKLLNEKHHIPPVSYDKTYVTKHEAGDESRFFPIIKPDTQTDYIMPQFEDIAQCNGEVSAASGSAVCQNPKGRKKIALLRDSFAISLAPYLNSTFKKATYLPHFDFRKGEIDIFEEADIVVLEQVERNIRSLVPLKFPDLN